MGDPWQDEGFAGEDDWDEGKESIEADLEEELGAELEDESWEDDEDEQ